MAESMSWWDGSAWRLTSELYVHSGGAFVEVLECYIWNGSAWKRCFVGGGSLGIVSVAVVVGDTVDVTWAFTAADPTQWLMTFEVSGDGSSYTTVDTGGDYYVDDAQPFEISLDAFGLTAADAYIRVSMRRDGNHATGSPKVVDPPHS
jgi:hypothetical protein